MTTRVLVVSHPAVVARNQLPYVALRQLDAEVDVVVPDRWRHELGGGLKAPEVHPDLTGHVHPTRVARPGAIQRHVHLTPPGRWLRRLRPDVVLVEEEPFSVPAAQWTVAARLRRIPVAVSGYENLDRPFPLPARALRRAVLAGVSGVFARTPAAARRVEQWGATCPVRVVPPAVPLPTTAPISPPDGPFTIGYAGRFVEAKGLRDLVAALDGLGPDCRLLAAGDGPLRPLLDAHPRIEVRTGVDHTGMAAFYAAVHVLVLPSRTTLTWAEQLGRVLLEAMAAERPVITSDSGEMPWVLTRARGGRTFPEGDVDALRGLLESARADPAGWRALAERGREDVAARFSPMASAQGLRALIDAMGQ